MFAGANMRGDDDGGGGNSRGGSGGGGGGGDDADEYEVCESYGNLPTTLGDGVGDVGRECDCTAEERHARHSHHAPAPSSSDRWRMMLAGAITGIVTKTTVAPLERVCYLLQVQGMQQQLLLQKAADAAAAAAAAAATSAPASASAALAGAAGASSAGSAAASASASASAAAAAAAAKAAAAEAEAAVARLQGGVMASVRRIHREEGVRGFFRGNGASVLRVVPVFALKFGVNDVFKDALRTSGVPLTFSQLMFAGSLAGAVQLSVCFPLELIRTRLAVNDAFTGIADCVRKTVRYEGWGGLFKGYWPTLFAGTPYIALQLAGYEFFKERFGVVRDVSQRWLRHSGTSAQQAPTLSSIAAAAPHVPAPVWWQVTSGALAGLVAQTITYPGDTIRRRMMNDGAGGSPRLYRSSVACLLQTVRREGAAALYAGWSTSLIRAVPSATVQFVTYDMLKRLLGC